MGLTMSWFCLAASTFDFSDMGGDSSQPDKSDDADPGAAPHSSDLAIFQRDRAFSFEFFNFAGDELLPAAATTHTSSSELPDPGLMSDTDEPPMMMGRPRGDSIIFDPVSFQDGGIHEKNALLKTRAASLDSVPEGLMSDVRVPSSNAW
mgnify:CR=1 FL=1